VRELAHRFALIRTPDDPFGPADPLSEAIALAARARTPREKLRALEQVRGATKLKLRGVELDPEDRALLDRNLAESVAAYEAAGDFETQARALSGWREAILHRLEAVRAPNAVETRLQVTTSDGEPLGEGASVAIAPSDYWQGVPSRFRDVDRFTVERTIKLAFGIVARGAPADVDVRVRDAAGALVFASEPTSATGGDPT
jgi:hypothetical protein